MRRSALIRHLRSYGCVLLREGRRHSIWINPDTNRRTAIPRHNEINRPLAMKICGDLGVPIVRRI